VGVSLFPCDWDKVVVSARCLVGCAIVFAFIFVFLFSWLCVSKASFRALTRFRGTRRDSWTVSGSIVGDGLTSIMIDQKRVLNETDMKETV